MYYLDSCICINLMRGRLPVTYKMMRASDPRLFGIPAVVEAELRTGAEKSARPEESRLLLERFLVPFARIPFDARCAMEYARVRASLEASGERIGSNDVLVAATAMANGAVLVSANIREFKRVKGLSLECWDEIDLSELPSQTSSEPEDDPYERRREAALSLADTVSLPDDFDLDELKAERLSRHKF